MLSIFIKFDYIHDKIINMNALFCSIQYWIKRTTDKINNEVDKFPIDINESATEKITKLV